MDSPSHIHSILQQLLRSQETTLHVMSAITNELSSFNHELSYLNQSPVTVTTKSPWSSYNSFNQQPALSPIAPCHHLNRYSASEPLTQQPPNLPPLPVSYTTTKSSPWTPYTTQTHSHTTTSPWISYNTFHSQPTPTTTNLNLHSNNQSLTFSPQLLPKVPPPPISDTKPEYPCILPTPEKEEEQRDDVQEEKPDLDEFLIVENSPKDQPNEETKPEKEDEQRDDELFLPLTSAEVVLHGVGIFRGEQPPPPPKPPDPINNDGVSTRLPPPPKSPESCSFKRRTGSFLMVPFSSTHKLVVFTPPKPPEFKALTENNSPALPPKPASTRSALLLASDPPDLLLDQSPSPMQPPPPKPPDLHLTAVFFQLFFVWTLKVQKYPSSLAFIFSRKFQKKFLSFDQNQNQNIIHLAPSEPFSSAGPFVCDGKNFPPSDFESNFMDEYSYPFIEIHNLCQTTSTNQSAVHFQIAHTADPTYPSTNSAIHLPFVPRAFQSISQFLSTSLPLHSNSLIFSRAYAANNTQLPINLHSQWPPYSSLCPTHFISIITVALASNIIMARKSYTSNISLSSIWPLYLSVFQKSLNRPVLSFSTNLFNNWQFFHPSHVLTRECDRGEIFLMRMMDKFTRFKQWDPGEFFFTTMASSIQFKQWDPGKLDLASFFSTLRTRLL